MKVVKILFGGAFNPPTLAHYNILRELSKRFNCEITLLPTNDHYSKGVKLVSFEDRYKMTCLMANKLSNCCVSDYESKQKEYRGTYYTLKDFPGYYFLIGYDQMASIDKWINYEKLIEENRFIVCPRSGYSLDNILKNETVKKYLSHFTILNDFPIFDMSSTEFRNTLNPSLVDEDMYKYIVEHKLY